MGNSQSTRPGTKIIFKNESDVRLKIKIDCDRKLDSIVMNSVETNVNLAVFGVNSSFKDTNEYEAYYIVNTSTSFTIINPHERKSFFPYDGDNLHAFMTIMTENDDGK